MNREQMEAHLTLHGWEPCAFGPWVGMWHVNRGLVYWEFGDQRSCHSPTISRTNVDAHIAAQVYCEFAKVEDPYLASLYDYIMENKL